METGNSMEFERLRLEIAGRGVIVTSWFDSSKQTWRANAPALLHLLGDISPDAMAGATREKAIQAVAGLLSRELSGQSRA